MVFIQDILTFVNKVQPSSYEMEKKESFDGKLEFLYIYIYIYNIINFIFNNSISYYHYYLLLLSIF